ncbi:MAG: hypothetical protein ACXW6K_24365 [Candidatus Binatia bacterium]
MKKNYFLRCLFFISQALRAFGNAPQFSFHAMSNAGSGNNAALPPHHYPRTGLERVLTLTIFQPVSCSQFDNFLLAIACRRAARAARPMRSAGVCARPRPHAVAEGVIVNGFAGWIHDKFLRKILWQFT